MKTASNLASALAIAISSPVLAQGLIPLDDADMSVVTGQAGITIEMDANVAIDRVAYSQNDGGLGQGALLLDDIRISGWQNGTDGGGNPTYDKLKLQVDVDIAANGDAIITLGNRGTSDPFELGIGVGSIGLGTNMSDVNTTTLISNLNIQALVGETTITATNSNPFDGGGDTGSLVIDSAFAIDDLDADLDIVALKLRDVRVAASGNLSTLMNGDPITAAMMSTNTVTLGSGNRLSDPTGLQANAMRMSVGASNLDIWVGNIELGGASIGSAAIQGLSMAGTEVAIYGR